MKDNRVIELNVSLDEAPRINETYGSTMAAFSVASQYNSLMDRKPIWDSNILSFDEKVIEKAGSLEKGDCVTLKGIRALREFNNRAEDGEIIRVSEPVFLVHDIV